MKYFSMFSGIGGFEYGIERANYFRSEQFSTQSGRWNENTEKNCEKNSFSPPEFCGAHPTELYCVGYSEIDKYAKGIYKYHFPDHTNWGDATQIKTKELPAFDLLVAGFPCQAFSIAGKRQGFKDTRGTLFFEIARVLKDKRPRHFILENVAGLLSHEEGKTFQTILRVLTTIGYRVEWQILNSKDFGVPQNRERVFIVGHLGRTSGGTIFPITGNNGKAPFELTKNASQDDRIYGVNDSSPTIHASCGRRHDPKILTHCLDANYQKGCNDLKKKNRTVVSVPLRYLDRNQKNFPTEYSMCVDSSNTTGVMKDQWIRRLTPIECERLQGFPDNYTKYGIDSGGGTIKVSDSQRYKCLGNAVTTTVITAIIKKLSEDV